MFYAIHWHKSVSNTISGTRTWFVAFREDQSEIKNIILFWIYQLQFVYYESQGFVCLSTNTPTWNRSIGHKSMLISKWAVATSYLFWKTVTYITKKLLPQTTVFINFHCEKQHFTRLNLILFNATMATTLKYSVPWSIDCEADYWISQRVKCVCAVYGWMKEKADSYWR